MAWSSFLCVHHLFTLHGKLFSIVKNVEGLSVKEKIGFVMAFISFICMIYSICSRQKKMVMQSGNADDDKDEDEHISIVSTLLKSKDEKILVPSLGLLLNLSRDMKKIKVIIQRGPYETLVDFLSHTSESVLILTLQTLRNLLWVNDNKIQEMVSRDILPLLSNLLTDDNKSTTITKEVCRSISNMTAGTKDQIQVVFEANIIPKLVKLFNTPCSCSGVKKEVVWVISNATWGASNNPIHYMVSQGCISLLCNLLLCYDSETVRICLDGLHNILKTRHASYPNKYWYLKPYTQIIEAAGGARKIEELQTHVEYDIYVKAAEILQQYWQAKEVED